MIKKDNLPPLLQEVLAPIKNEEQSLMGLLTFTTVFPAVFGKVYFPDASKDQRLNMIAVILLPPASGKNIINSVGKVLQPIQHFLRNGGTTTDGNTFNSTDMAPEGFSDRKSILVSADITAAKFASKLAENHGKPLVIMETELSTFTNSGSGEHGRQLAGILLKAMEFEPISLERKTKNEEIYIDEPWLGGVLSGTPNQFVDLLKNTSTGLHSRLLFLRLKGSDEWRSARPTGTKAITLDDGYTELGKKLLDIHKRFRGVDVVVNFSEEQWTYRDTLGQEWENRYDGNVDPDARSIARRAVNHLFKIAASLTLMRHCDIIPSGKELVLECHEEDLNSAALIMEPMLKSSFEIFFEMESLNPSRGRSARDMTLLTRLPGIFSAGEAENLGIDLGYGSRSSRRYVQSLVLKGLLEKVGNGQYQKVLKQEQLLTPA